MRHSIGIIPFLLAIGALPAVATPAYYAINFTLTSGTPLPISGSFFYDSATTTFTSFDVVWDGDAFDLTSAANTSPNNFIPGLPCVNGSSSGAQEVFKMLTSCAGSYWDANLSAVSPTTPSFLFDNGAYGTISSYGVQVIDPGQPTGPSTAAAGGGFSASLAPEPGSWALMGIGLGLVMRKRIARGLRLSRRE